jgi:hypothetical protein
VDRQHRASILDNVYNAITITIAINAGFARNTSFSAGSLGYRRVGYRVMVVAYTAGIVAVQPWKWSLNRVVLLSLLE